jgi:thiamine biosynthesis lipoprotein
VRRLRIAMGTTLAIEARAPSAAAAHAAIGAAFSAVAEVDRHMNPDRPGSDLERLSSAAPGTRILIHSSTSEVLRLARRVHTLTDGVFDPCLPQRPGRLCDLELEPGRWAICHAPLALDLGGIAKGYAVDRAIEALLGAGCDAGLVNAGGDLRVFGPQRVPLLLRHPDGRLEPIELANAALAVSDRRSAHRPAAHRGYYLRIGRARAARRFAAVVAPATATADALTKCVLLCAPQDAARVLHELGARELDGPLPG